MNGSKRTARWRRAAPTMPSSSSRSATSSTTVCVSCTSSTTWTAGWACWNAQRSRGTTIAAGPVEAPIASSPATSALGVGGDVVEDLLLELQQPLRAAVEAPAGLGRLDLAARAVEELGVEALLERPHLERDGRLRDAEPLRRLREAPALDDGTEGGELARVHKEILSHRSGDYIRRCMIHRRIGSLPDRRHSPILTCIIHLCIATPSRSALSSSTTASSTGSASSRARRRHPERPGRRRARAAPLREVVARPARRPAGVGEGILVAYCDLMRTPTKERFAAALAKTIFDDLASARDRSPSAPPRSSAACGSGPRWRSTPTAGTPVQLLGLDGTREDIDDTIERLLELPGRIAAERKRRVALVLDEFQEVVRLDETFPNLMRSVFQTQPEVVARLPRQPPARDRVDLQRPQRAVLAERPQVELGRLPADALARVPPRPVRRDRAGDRRRCDRPAARDHRRAPVRDAGARLLHVGARSARARRPRRRRRARRCATCSAPSTTTSRGCGRAATQNERLVLLALRDGPLRPLLRGDPARRRAADADLRPARRRGARRATTSSRGCRRRRLAHRRAVPARVDRRQQRGRPGDAPDARLDRHDELAARAVLPAARPAARGARPRGDGLGARAFAQTLELLDDAGIAVRGRRPAPRGRRPRREGARRWPRGSTPSAGSPGGVAFDVALSHASHELPLAARSLGIPSAYAYDYEFATAQHGLGSRAATRVDRPGRDPAGRASTGSARTRGKVRRYAGPEGGVLPRRLRPPTRRCSPASASTRRGSSSSCARRPRCRSTTSTAIRSSTRRSAALGVRSGRPGGRAAADARRSATALRALATAVARRSRARGRRAQPRRRGRPRRLRRRHDEPRGGRARDAGVHDLSGPARARSTSSSSPRAGCASSARPTSSWSSRSLPRRARPSATPR